MNKLKTGTTCIGLLFKDGVILAADRRATAGYIATERTIKVYNVADKILATTAGHAADNQLVMRHIKGELRLLELKVEREVMVKEAAMILNSIQYSMLRSQGSIVSLILGGYDKKDGYSLYNLGADGTILENEGYVVDGSGMVFIKGVLDNEYNIYPIPANDVLNIEGLSPNSRLTVYSISGKELRHIEATQSTTSMNISDFEKGVYFLKISAQGNSEIFKFIKE